MLFDALCDFFEELRLIFDKRYRDSYYTNLARWFVDTAANGFDMTTKGQHSMATNVKVTLSVDYVPAVLGMLPLYNGIVANFSTTNSVGELLSTDNRFFSPPAGNSVQDAARQFTRDAAEAQVAIERFKENTGLSVEIVYDPSYNGYVDEAGIALLL